MTLPSRVCMPASSGAGLRPAMPSASRAPPGVLSIVTLVASPSAVSTGVKYTSPPLVE
ncbi:hypothetical protein ABH917_001483 [Thermobifida halotolerans]